MKIKYLLPAILFLAFNAFTQSVDLPVDNETKKITYTGVVEIDKGIKKGTIISRLSEWVKEKKYLAKTKQDPESYAFKGTIVLFYQGATTGKNDKGLIEFICTVYPKDGKYKYVYSNFKHTGESGNGGALENEKPDCGKYVLPFGSWTKIKEQVKNEMPEIIASMKKSIVANGIVQKKKNPADF